MKFTFKDSTGKTYDVDSYDIGSAAMAIRQAAEGMLPYMDRDGREMFGKQAKETRQFEVGIFGEKAVNQSQRDQHLKRLYQKGFTLVTAPPLPLKPGQTGMRASNSGDSGPLARGSSDSEKLKAVTLDRIDKGVDPEVARKEYLAATKAPREQFLDIIQTGKDAANMASINSAVNTKLVKTGKMKPTDYVASQIGIPFNTADYVAANLTQKYKLQPTVDPENYVDFWHAVAPNLTAKLDTEKGFLAGIGRTALTIATPANLIPFGAGAIGKNIGFGIMVASAPSIIGGASERVKAGDTAGAVGEIVALAAPFAIHGVSKAHSSLINEGAIRYGLRNLNHMTPEEMVKLGSGIDASPKFKNIDTSLPIKEAIQNVTPLDINKPKLADAAYVRVAKASLENLITKLPDGDFDVTLINGKKVGFRYGAEESQTNIVDPSTGEKQLGYDDIIWLRDGAGPAELRHELFHVVERLGLVPRSLIEAGIKRYGSVENMAREYESYKSPTGPIGYLKQLGGKLADLVSDRGKLAFTKMAERIDSMDAFTRPADGVAPLEPAFFRTSGFRPVEGTILNENRSVIEAVANAKSEDISSIPEVRSLLESRNGMWDEDPNIAYEQRDQLLRRIQNEARTQVERYKQVDAGTHYGEPIVINPTRDLQSRSELPAPPKRTEGDVIVEPVAQPKNRVQRAYDWLALHFTDEHKPMLAVIDSGLKAEGKSQFLRDTKYDPLYDIFTKHKNRGWNINPLEMDVRLLAGSSFKHYDRTVSLKESLTNTPISESEAKMLGKGSDVQGIKITKADIKNADAYLKSNGEIELSDGGKVVLARINDALHQYFMESSLVNPDEFKDVFKGRDKWDIRNFVDAIENVKKFSDVSVKATSLSEVFRGLSKAGELSDREFVKAEIFSTAGEAGAAKELTAAEARELEKVTAKGAIASRDNIHVFISNGNTRYMLTVPEISHSIKILEGMNAADQASIAKLWRGLVNKTKRILVSMPDFMLRNFERDLQDRWIRGEYRNPFESGYKSYGEKNQLTNAGEARNLFGRYGEAENLRVQSGGSTEGWYMRSPEEYLAHMDEVLGLAKDGKLTVVLNGYREGGPIKRAVATLLTPVEKAVNAGGKAAGAVGKGYRDAGSKVESINRNAEFMIAKDNMSKRLLKEGNSDYGIKSEAELDAMKGTPEWEAEVRANDARIEKVANAFGAYRARGLMDFSKGGVTSKWLDKNWLPFFNPTIQGLTRTLTNGVEHPVQAFLRFNTVIMLPRLIAKFVAVKNGYDEEYKDLPTWRREAGLNFKIGNNWWFIPQPFENAMFGGVAERLIGQYAGDVFIHGNKVISEDTMLGVKAVPLMISMFGVDNGLVLGPAGALAEVALNRKAMTGANIITQTESQMKVSERKTRYSKMDTPDPVIKPGIEDSTFISRIVTQNKLIEFLTAGQGMDPRAFDYMIQSQLGGPARVFNSLQKTIESKATGNKNLTGVFDMETLRVMFGGKPIAGTTSQFVMSARELINQYALTRPKPEMEDDAAYEQLRSDMNDLLSENSDLYNISKATKADSAKRIISAQIGLNGKSLYLISLAMLVTSGKITKYEFENMKRKAGLPYDKAIEKSTSTPSNSPKLGPPDAEGFQEVKSLTR